MKTGNFELLLFLTKQTTCWGVIGGLVISHVHKSICPIWDKEYKQRDSLSFESLFSSIRCGYYGAHVCVKQPTWWPAGRGKHREMLCLDSLLFSAGEGNTGKSCSSTAGWNTPDCTSGNEDKEEKQHCVQLGWFHLLHPESKCWPRQDLYPAGIICILCLSCRFCMLCPEQRKPIFSSLDFELPLPWVWIETTAKTAKELKSFSCLISIYSSVCFPNVTA